MIGQSIHMAQLPSDHQKVSRSSHHHEQVPSIISKLDYMATFFLNNRDWGKKQQQNNKTNWYLGLGIEKISYYSCKPENCVKFK